MKWGMYIHDDTRNEIGAWLVAADFDTPVGTFIFTASPALAMPFESAGDVLDYWRTQSKTFPLRPDGRPNRPLTAFSIEPRTLPQEGS